MIKIGSFSALNPSLYDENWLIVRKPDEAMCHRSIIGGVLLGMGAEIDTKPEYKKYYDALTEIRGDACVRRILEGKEII